MSKANQYIESIKNQPGTIFIHFVHFALFAIMCFLSSKILNSLESVFPEGVDLGSGAIYGSLGCALILIIMLIRAPISILGMGLGLLVLMTAMEALEYGAHWMYSRELSSSKMAQAEIDRQTNNADALAGKNADRTERVVTALAEYNKTQTKLNESDAAYFARTGIRRSRKMGNLPSFEDLGLIVPGEPPPSPTPGQTGPVVMSSSLGAIKTSVSDADAKPLTEVQVLAKWTPRFTWSAIGRLMSSFVLLAALVGLWHYRAHKNPIKTEGK